jgi:hypothetical protein
MTAGPEFILGVLDQCSRDCSFPMLDNGYVYLAASRLSLHHSPQDWALVIEIFGYSPRAAVPDLQVSTFASRFHKRHLPETYTPEQCATYLSVNPHNDSAYFFPIAEGDWMGEAYEMVSPSGFVELRGKRLPLPPLHQYAGAGIRLSRKQPAIFELCRYLAAHHRDAVLATDVERRVSVPPELTELLGLEDWHHPDGVAGELPSETSSFRQLARVLATGDTHLYSPDESPNTHWKHWPLGGAL